MPPIEAKKLQCVNDRLKGRILGPGQDNWDEARGAFNVLLDQRPAAIALPADAHDVTMVVRLAAEHGLRVAPQSTGHGAGALGDLEDTILLKTSAMTQVSVDGDAKCARTGAGARWQDLAPHTSGLGLAALQGFSPGVGIVGYSLGGGLGWYSRKFGLASNSVSAVELVAPDGRHLRASADSEPDLFWALRGGVGNFGVVTEIEFRLYDVGEIYAGGLFFPFERAAEVLSAWNEWQATAPDEVTSVGRLLQFPPLDVVPEPMRGKSFAIVQAAYLGSETDGAELIAPLRDLGPAMDTFTAVAPDALGTMHMDPAQPAPAVSGDLLLGELPASAIDDLVAVAGPGSGSILTSVELRQTRGALARPEPSCGALAAVPGALALYAVASPPNEDAAETMRGQIAAVISALSPHEAGRLLNFADQPLDTAGAFSPESFSHLQKVKAQYDPDGVMHANHQVPAA